MSNALLPPDFASQTRHGIAARVVHHIGGALRRAFAGITRAGGALRRPAPPANRPVPASRDPGAATPPKPPRAPRRKPAAPPPQAAQPAAKPGWFARCFARKPRQAAKPCHPLFAYGEDGRYTPDSRNGLTPEACAILNTPAGECSPEMLRMLLAAIAEDFAASMPPELGLTDPQAMFATLWSRLGAALEPREPDAPPVEPPADPPAEMCHAAPAEPPASAEVPSEAPPATGPVSVANVTAIVPSAAATLPDPGIHPHCPRRRGLYRDHRMRFVRHARDRPQGTAPWRLYPAACTRLP